MIRKDKRQKQNKRECSGKKQRKMKEGKKIG